MLIAVSIIPPVIITMAEDARILTGKLAFDE
jgi:hypothetical protein